MTTQAPTVTTAPTRTRPAETAPSDAGGTAAPPATTPSRTPWRRAASVALSVLVVAVLALAVAVVAVPKALGAVPLTVLSGSMEPVLSPGDVVVVRPVAADDLRIGDVVTFQPVSDDPSLVTHRVVGIGSTGGAAGSFTTRGDANGADDEPIVADQVVGRVAYSVPLVGHLTNASWGPTAVTVAAAALIGYGLLMLVLPDRSRRGAPDA
ncbi:signal peptidase I [Oerskovia jenensis]|uniref:signal peptidase I n=1 Tax=Oerskovia jenensis TaxID=162169 RepID=UPI0036D8DDA8